MDNNIETKMNSSVRHFEKELSSLRTSRANPSILDNIYVDAYGSKTPLNQLGNISVQYNYNSDLGFFINQIN